MRLSALSMFCIIVLVFATAPQCAGSRGTVKFHEVKVKVSASSYLEVQDQNLNLPDRLQLITKFAYSKRIWGVFYTGLTLTPTDSYAHELNAAVEQNNADGIVNFTAEAEPCAINSTIVLNLLPVFPGCTIFTIKGDVVKRK